MTSEDWKKRLEESIEKYPDFTPIYRKCDARLQTELDRIDDQVQKQSWHPKGIKGANEKANLRKEFVAKIEDIDMQAEVQIQKEELEVSKKKEFDEVKIDIAEVSPEIKEQIAQAKSERDEKLIKDEKLEKKMQQLQPEGDAAANGAEVRQQEEIKAEEIRQQKIQEEVRRAQEARERMAQKRRGFER